MDDREWLAREIDPSAFSKPHWPSRRGRWQQEHKDAAYAAADRILAGLPERGWVKEGDLAFDAPDDPDATNAYGDSGD